MEPVQFWTLVISLIGAAAWIPHLISLVITLTKRPLITITPSSHADVGFTELGPIINIKVAITSDNGDSLIDLIELDVRHESGSKYKFRWHEVSEMKGQMLVSGVSSESISQFLESEATAIKVLQSDLKDVLLRNRMHEHTVKNRKYGYEIIKERRRLVNNNQYVPENFYVTKAAQDLQAFLQSQMIWKKGKYTIQFHLNTRTNTKIVSPELSFELSDDDIILLQSNCDNMPKLVHNFCYSGYTENSADIIPLEWQWLDKELLTV